LTISLYDINGFVIGAPTLGTFLIIAIAVPVVGEVIREIGPLLLASRPQFDDLMDGLTFGVISGVAYACFDTLVRHWALLTGGIAQIDPGHWVSLIFLEGFVKPLIMGTATGIACAEFSGLGKGYDGFTPRYFGGLVSAIVANIAYQAGGYLFSFVGSPTLGTTLQIIWALIILGTLLLRIRVVLHAGLMEAALEQAARQGSPGATGELQFCAHCEMPLIDNASFCNACGSAVRAQRKALKVPVPASAGAGGTPAPEGDWSQGGASAVRPETPPDATGWAQTPGSDLAAGDRTAENQFAADQSSQHGSDQSAPAQAVDQGVFDQTAPDHQPDAADRPGGRPGATDRVYDQLADDESEAPPGPGGDEQEGRS
jgi:hypothetical protein